MIEALELFEEINSNPAFEKTTMILFLNKKDLFEDKIKNVPINETAAFKDYGGGDDFDAGVDYFTKLFLAKKGNPDKDVTVYPTCATDTKNVEIVFNGCKQIILKKNMMDSGFM